MKLLLTLLFSFYASLDALILTETNYTLTQQIKIALISSFMSAAGCTLGSYYLPYLSFYTVEEIIIISLLFLILYLCHDKAQKFTLLKSMIKENPKPEVVGFLLGIQHSGFGFLAGLKLISGFSMMICVFMFSCLCINQKSLSIFNRKIFSILFLFIIIICVYKK